MPRINSRKGHITEYTSTVWDANSKESTAKIEKVQRRAERFTTWCYERTAWVTTMVQNLGWPTLQQRRSYTNLVMFYKVAHHLIAIPVSIQLPLTDLTNHVSRHHPSLVYQISHNRIDACLQTVFHTKNNSSVELHTSRNSCSNNTRHL